MGPIRTSQKSRQGEASSSTDARKSKSKLEGRRPPKESQILPGVQKIKASLRQTKRLLSKDRLAADVRVETERRLKALEADLARAESSRKERDIAVRYHKVKFFERQKVVRKLGKVKNRLASADAPSKSQLEAALFDLRVDLNYILHYPKKKKYISLFPSEVRETASTVAEMTKVSPDSEEVRSWIRSQMQEGHLSLEPELYLGTRGADNKKSSSQGNIWDGNPEAPKLLNAKATDQFEAPEKDDFFDDEEEFDE